MHGYADQKHAVQKTVQSRAQRRVRHENTYASRRSVRTRYYIPRQGKTIVLLVILIGCIVVLILHREIIEIRPVDTTAIIWFLIILYC